MTTRTVGYLAFLLAGIYLLIRFLLPFVLPFVLGIFLAFILEPVLRFMTSRLRLSRGGSAAILVLIMVGAMLFLASWTVTRIAAEVTELYGYLPQYYGEFNRIIAEILRVAGDISEQLPEPLARAAQDQWNRLYSLLSAIVSGAGGVVRTVPSFTINTVFTFLATFFVMKDRAAIGRFLRGLLPAGAFAHFKNVEMDMLGGIAGFIRAQTVLILVTMVINILGLTFLGSRYSVALGMLLALLDLLPIVGPGLVYLPWIGYQLIWGTVSQGLGLLVLYGVVSLLRQVIQTHVVGREMGLHPLVALFSLYAGVKLFGAPGVIYGPLAAILVKTLWASGVIPHEGGAA
ncbi:MAG: sporulation integral membrane protein YtvI [Bacillota bacterium]